MEEAEPDEEVGKKDVYKYHWDESGDKAHGVRSTAGGKVEAASRKSLYD